MVPSDAIMDLSDLVTFTALVTHPSLPEPHSQWRLPPLQHGHAEGVWRGRVHRGGGGQRSVTRCASLLACLDSFLPPPSSSSPACTTLLRSALPLQTIVCCPQYMRITSDSIRGCTFTRAPPKRSWWCCTHPPRIPSSTRPRRRSSPHARVNGTPYVVILSLPLSLLLLSTLPSLEHLFLYSLPSDARCIIVQIALDVPASLFLSSPPPPPLSPSPHALIQFIIVIPYCCFRAKINKKYTQQ